MGSNIKKIKFLEKRCPAHPPFTLQEQNYLQRLGRPIFNSVGRPLDRESKSHTDVYCQRLWRRSLDRESKSHTDATARDCRDHWRENRNLTRTLLPRLWRSLNRESKSHRDETVQASGQRIEISHGRYCQRLSRLQDRESKSHRDETVEEASGSGHAC